MSCNKDSNCLKIANTTYPDLQSEVDDSISSLEGQIDEVLDTLNALYIPDDYLGKKVEEHLKEICDGFTEDKDSISSFKSSVDTFVSEQITDHRKHYNEWKDAQAKNNKDNKVEQVVNKDGKAGLLKNNKNDKVELLKM